MKWFCKILASAADVFILGFENSSETENGAASAAFAVWTHGTEVVGKCGDHLGNAVTMPTRRDCGHLYINKAACLGDEYLHLNR